MEGKAGQFFLSSLGVLWMSPEGHCSSGRESCAVAGIWENLSLPEQPRPSIPPLLSLDSWLFPPSLPFSSSGMVKDQQNSSPCPGVPG